MERREIIKQIKVYFSIEELVCPHTFQKFGKDISWQFLSTEYLHTLLVIRKDILKAGMTCNNYHQGGKMSERGLRCNICSIPKEKTSKNSIYLSAHCCGEGGDFTISGMTADQARKKIDLMKYMLPYPIRMEKDVTWLHFDVYDALNNNKITYFAG